ncbi:hypothetical protein ADIS_3241 [Lunatimonas lonarensis]|uniref:Uncharacterized protein n=1 Tax=Lunatimonas lonarensis TaxID=1232681 RepID=R7ZPZ1_9BACT|nr:hypothetical protein ADIS_3241 [Lunatimonas lonarensis]
MNAEIQGFVKNALSWGDRKADEYADYEEAAEDFIAVFEKAETDGFNGMDWFFTLEGSEAFRSSDLISLRFSTYHFTGGAHPNGFQTLLTYDLKGEGAKVEDNSLVLDEKRLLEIALAKFRAYHEVADGVSLEDDGRFFLDEGRFFLPQTMGYGDGVFLLIYNAYEIGPYVIGVTELEIPIEELGGVVRQPLF